MNRIVLEKKYQLGSTDTFTRESNYPNTSSPQYSVSQEKGIEYTDTEHYTSINSGSRDATNYPLHYDYKIHLNSDYRNVVKVSLVSIVFPNTSGILDEPYLTIDLGELNFIDFESATLPHRGFCMLPMKAPTQAVGGYVNPDLSVACQTSLVLTTPMARLSSLSIKIRDYNGEIYNFGNASGSTSKTDQHSFMLKIVTREVSRKQLDNRSVF